MSGPSPLSIISAASVLRHALVPKAAVAPQANANYQFTPFEESLEYSRYYSDDRRMKFLKRLWNPKQTTYAAIGNREQSKYGTIGVLAPAGVGFDRSAWPAMPQITSNNVYKWFGDFEMHFDDGRVIKVNVYNQNLYWLPDHVGPTVWNFKKKPKKPDVEVKDKLGNDIKVGDFIAFAYSGYYKSDLALKFGFVEEITPRGVITVKSLKLNDDDVSHNYKFGSADKRICKMNKEIIDELMLRRLTF